MRLAELLAELSQDQLERLAAHHLGQERDVSRAVLCSTLESVLKSYSFVRDFVFDRRPPTFTILETLLEADGWAAPLAGFRELVMEGTKDLCTRVASGDLVGRDDGLRLYRRVLTEARRNSIEIDPSEAAILGVLRRELSIRQVEHFILEHHPDLQQFWNADHAFLDEMNALRLAGLVFAHAGQVCLAEEVVPLVRRVLGVELPRTIRSRLFGKLSVAELQEVLSQATLKTSGSKDEKIDRALLNRISGSEALQAVSLASLRDLCREAGINVSGSKEDLVDRLVQHFASGGDRAAPPAVEVVVEAEPKRLDEPRFRALFGSLKGDELSDILTSTKASRSSGTKDAKVSLLWDGRFCEMSLLLTLTNKALDEVFERLRLRVAGAKRERIERLIQHFAEQPLDALGPLSRRTGDGGTPNSTSSPGDEREGAFASETVGEQVAGQDEG